MDLRVDVGGVTLIDGVSFQFVRENRAIRTAQKLEFLAQAAEGLAAVHKAGIIHHDINQHNFLVDRAVVQRIVAAIDPQPQDAIIEIGPGHGVLTRALLERVERLQVVEIDRDLAADQVLAGDVLLLVERVARQLDRLHAVEQRPRDRVEDVGGGDEDDVGEVELEVQVVTV